MLWIWFNGSGSSERVGLEKPACKGIHGNQWSFIVNIILPTYAKFFHFQEILLKKEISRPEIPAEASVPMYSKDRLRFALLTVTDQSK